METPLTDFLARGALFGLAAGFSPGPLTFLVLRETLAHGLRAGIKVAFAPALTDVPIIVLTGFAVEKLLRSQPAAGSIALVGGLFLVYLGYSSLTFRGARLPEGQPRSRSLGKGVAVNLLNPNPYIFWATVGTPAILDALGISLLHAAAFAGSFFATIIGSKIALAAIVSRLSTFLGSSAYRWIMRILGLLLLGYAALLFRDGLAHLGFIE
jgi:threonine/homoserine/homoserine lactone efflux protein